MSASGRFEPSSPPGLKATAGRTVGRLTDEAGSKRTSLGRRVAGRAAEGPHGSDHLLLPFALTAMTFWAYLRREMQVDQRLGFKRDEPVTRSDAMPREAVMMAIRRVPGVALMLAALLLMERSATLAKIALLIAVAWFAVEGFRVRVLPHKLRGANSREMRELTLLFITVVLGLAVIGWQATSSRVG